MRWERRALTFAGDGGIDRLRQILSDQGADFVELTLDGELPNPLYADYRDVLGQDLGFKNLLGLTGSDLTNYSTTIDNLYILVLSGLRWPFLWPEPSAQGIGVHRAAVPPAASARAQPNLSRSPISACSCAIVDLPRAEAPLSWLISG